MSGVVREVQGKDDSTVPSEADCAGDARMWPVGSAAQAPRRYRGITASERRAQRRERLLQAGLELFGTQGYASTSIRAVSAEASMNSRYFYESFSSREDLLYYVYERIVQDIVSADNRSVRGMPTRSRAKRELGCGPAGQFSPRTGARRGSSLWRLSASASAWNGCAAIPGMRSRISRPKMPSRSSVAAGGFVWTRCLPRAR